MFDAFFRSTLGGKIFLKSCFIILRSEKALEKCLVVFVLQGDVRHHFLHGPLLAIEIFAIPVSEVFHGGFKNRGQKRP